MNGDRGTMDATQDAGSTTADGHAGITAKQLAQRLEDAVERSMNDLESERAAVESLRPDVNGELTAQRVDAVADER